MSSHGRGQLRGKTKIGREGERTIKKKRMGFGSFLCKLWRDIATPLAASEWYFWCLNSHASLIQLLLRLQNRPFFIDGEERDELNLWLIAVVAQYYEADVNKEHVIRGNAAIIKCLIPSFVADFVEVVSWHTDQDDVFHPGTDYGSLRWSLVAYIRMKAAHFTLLLLKIRRDMIEIREWFVLLPIATKKRQFNHV